MTKKLIGMYNVRELLTHYTKEQVAKAIYEDMREKMAEMDREKKKTKRNIGWAPPNFEIGKR